MNENTSPELETKVAEGMASLSVTTPFDGFMQVFEAFKQANDQRLAEMEERLDPDVVTTDLVERLNNELTEQKAKLDRLSIKTNRPALGPVSARNTNPHSSEHKAAFETYVRKGDAGHLGAFEAKSLAAESNPDGGFVVPEETEVTIGALLAEVSPIRAIADVRQVSMGVYKKPFVVSGAGAGWVAETAARPETNSPVLAELQFPAMELYAMPAATQTLLDDSAVDIDAWIAREVQTAFAEQEGAAFINGDGVTQPQGFLNVPMIDDSSWSWGNIGFKTTGVDGGFAASDASDDLIDLVYCLRAGYRQNAHWVMNQRTQAEVRKLKDADGNYLWRPATSADGSATLMNYPIAEAEDMPDIAVDTAAIAFGDFRRGYLIVDRLGVRILRDPYSSKPYVLFYTTKRVGGGVQNFEAIKLLRFSA